MNKINNEKYNAAYDLINRNILSNPDKIAFIDNNNNKITYNELFIKVKSGSLFLFKGVGTHIIITSTLFISSRFSDGINLLLSTYFLISRDCI